MGIPSPGAAGTRGAGGSSLFRNVCLGVTVAMGLFGTQHTVTHAHVTAVWLTVPVAGVGLRKSSGDSHAPSPWKTAVRG